MRIAKNIQVPSGSFKNIFSKYVFRAKLVDFLRIFLSKPSEHKRGFVKKRLLGYILPAL